MGGFDVRVASLAYSAWTSWYLGYPDLASERCGEALARARTLSDHHTIALALHFSAYLSHCRRDGAAVQSYASELFELSSRYGFVHWLACGTIMQGCASVMHGQYTEGIKKISDGIEIWKSASAKLGLTDFIGKLAHAYAKAYEQAEERDKTDLAGEALGLVEEGLRLSKVHNETHYRPELYRIKGELVILTAPQIATGAGRSFENAECLFRHAIEVARGQDGKSMELRAAKSLSRLLISQGRVGEAREILSQAYDRFTEGFDTADLARAKGVLNCITQGGSEPPSLPSSL